MIAPKNSAYHEIIQIKAEDIPIMLAFHQKNAQKNIFELHWHEEPEFLYIRSGEMEIHCGESTFHVTPGEIVFINPGEQHAGVCLSGSCEYIWLAVKTSFLKSAGLSGSDLCFSSLEAKRLKIRNQLGKNPEIAMLIDGIIADYHEKPPYYELEIKASLLRLFRCLLIGCTAQIAEHESEIPPSLQPVLSYIDAHFKDEITSAQLAKMSSFSAPYFCRIFKETTGYSPIEYVNRVRIRKAYEMISSTNESFASIAESVGFLNFSYFSKLFFKYTGQKPAEIRKQAEI